MKLYFFFEFNGKKYTSLILDKPNVTLKKIEKVLCYPYLISFFLFGIQNTGVTFKPLLSLN